MQYNEPRGGIGLLTEVERTRLWENWLSAEIRAYYFADISSQYIKREQCATFLVLGLSSSALATLLAQFQAWVPAVLTAATALLSVYLVIFQNYRLALDSAELHERWNRLAREYERLWGQMYDEDAARRLAALEDQGGELSRKAIGLRASKRRLLKWQDYVEQQHHVASVPV